MVFVGSVGEVILFSNNLPDGVVFKACGDKLVFVENGVVLCDGRMFTGVYDICGSGIYDGDKLADSLLIGAMYNVVFCDGGFKIRSHSGRIADEVLTKERVTSLKLTKCVCV